jgi:hypothetical protein
LFEDKELESHLSGSGRVLPGDRRIVDDAAIRFDAQRFLNAERT